MRQKSIKSDVFQRGTLIACTHLLAATLVTSASVLRADDSTPNDGRIVINRQGVRVDGQTTNNTNSNADDGTHIVNVSVGGKTIPIKVRDEANPLKKVHMDDPLDHQRVFSETSPMANKIFDMPTGTFAKSDDHDKNNFITKSYTDPNTQTAFGFTPAETHAAAFSSKTSHDFDHGYSTANGQDAAQHQSFNGATSSDDQDRTAVAGGEKQDLSVDPMANKQYLGPGAQNVPEGILVKENIILTRVSGIPDRQLTIDEVRNLINSGTKPNLNEKPDEPSKPLNDPNYQPEPLRGDPSPPPLPSNLKAIDDDKDDPIPSPGMMSTPPENTEALPQKH